MPRPMLSRYSATILTTVDRGESMPLERAVVVRGSLSGSSAAKDRRTVEERVRPVAKWGWISLDWRLGSALPTRL